MKVCSSYSIFSPAWAVFCVSDIGYFDWYKLSKLPPTCVSLFEHYLLRSLFYWVICFLYLQFLGTYYVWNINALLDMKLVKFFPQSLACHFVKLKYLLSYRNFSVAWGINFFYCCSYCLFYQCSLQSFSCVNEFKAIPHFLFYQILCISIPDFVNTKKISS